ncbi:outer membrane beta-barrel protein [Kordia sp. YSTF-M3]|uniref:Outer membrane beta-barrel protein n=1 Tax=Kordia aestuariivivens TaxID=2759037 RepID=A0ABR7QDV4_9FLAO|nr:outer membrane beta-barrel family protein [Kordia aestuariivivens]MBC8756499.1 outer membrane beta-barrel protein [Kordia aestuariivivens]
MKHLLTFLAIFCAHVSFSQIEVKGLVKDSKGPVPFATVVLKDAENTVKHYDITDENGTFSINAQLGTFTMEISILGYQTWNKSITVQNATTLDDIVLEASREELDKVVVKAQKRLIERKPDRLIFNVENSIAASGGNAIDALRVAPGLSVESDGVSMIGKGVSRVMVDGRIIQLSGEELVGFLNSISSDDIKKIEIITNPPAKYEAAGSGGLINIVYKKGVGDFWKNTTTLSYTQNTYSFYTLRNSFVYNKNKFKLNFSLNGDKGDIRIIETLDTDYPSGPWNTRLDLKEQKDNISSRFSLDYALTDNTTIGAQYMGNFNAPDTRDRNITEIRNNQNQIDSIYDNVGTSDRSVKSHMLNAHLISKLDTLGKTLSVDLDYFSYGNDLVRDYVVNTFNPSGQFLNINQAIINRSKQSIDNYSMRVDMEQPTKFANISYGGKINFIKTINDLRTFDTASGAAVFNAALSDEFEYKENVQALYVNGYKKLNDKWQMQLGFRLENTITEGFSTSLNQTNKNDYLKLFPTFYVSYAKNENNYFSFNYGRRITRPSFRELNPFRFFNNSNSFSEGNPFLQPSFTDNFDFNYTYKRVLTTNIFASSISDGYGTIFSADPVTNTQAVIRRNYYKRFSMGIAQIYSFRKISWWQSQNQVMLIGYKSDFSNSLLDAEPQNGFQFYADTYNTFIVNDNTKLQLDFFYSSPLKDRLSTYGERYGLDFGVRKSYLNNDLQFSLFVKDILDTGSFRNIVSNVNGVDVTYGENRSRRYFRFSVSYNFGNNKINVRNRNFGSDEEKGRTN